jgi:hypothetical protein
VGFQIKGKGTERDRKGPKWENGKKKKKKK